MSRPRTLLLSALGLAVAAPLAMAQSVDLIPVGGFAAHSSQIGRTVALSDASGKMRLYASSNEDGRHWFAMEHDPAIGGYHYVYVSERRESRVSALRIGPVLPGGAEQLVYVEEDGMVLVHDLVTHELLESFDTGVGDIEEAILHDLDGDGVAEILVCDDPELRVFSGTGALLGDFQGQGGNDLAAGQMDADPGMEIATTDGKVLDWATGTVQTTWPAGFGVRLASADIDGDSMEELVYATTGPSDCWGFQVDLGVPSWSFNFGVATPVVLELEDVDGDLVPDILLSTTSSGDGLMAFSASTRLPLWTDPRSMDDVDGIALGDTDGDGDIEVAWSGSSFFSAHDHLHVSDLATREYEWRSDADTGPFTPPVLADLEDDGVPEVVFASSASGRPFYGGQLHAMDQDLRPICRPRPLVRGQATRSAGVHAIDLDLDGRDEVIVVTSAGNDGFVEVYTLRGRRLQRYPWPAQQGAGSRLPYSSVIADVDQDGVQELIIGSGGTNSSVPGNSFRILDVRDGALEFDSFDLHPDFEIRALAVGNLDQDPALEIVAVPYGDEAWIFDGATHMPQATIRGEWTGVQIMPGPPGQLPFVMLSGLDGELVSYYPQYPRPRPVNTWPVALSELQSFSLDAGNAYFCVDGALELHAFPPVAQQPLGRTADYGRHFGQNPLYLSPTRFLAAGQSSVILFEIQ